MANKIPLTVQRLFEDLEELESTHENSLCIAAEQMGGKINKDIERTYSEHRERFRWSIYSLGMQSGLTHEEITEIHSYVRDCLRGLND